MKYFGLQDYYIQILEEFEGTFYFDSFMPIMMVRVVWVGWPPLSLSGFRWRSHRI